AYNLLTNAVKFTPAGGAVDVHLRRSPGGDGIELVVRDTGEGIDAAFLAHVFDRFRMADAGTTRRHGGLGIGLAIAHHIVALSGGTIVVESEGHGRGATFTVRLPLSAPRLHPVVPRGVAGPSVPDLH